MSSKRHLRRSKCERKIRFPNSVAAKIRAKQLVKAGGDLLTAYPCEFCKGWHLGHSPQRFEQAKAQKIAEFKARKRIDSRAA